MHAIKAVLFDLDDTLFDCSGTLVKDARKRAARAMVLAGLPTTVPHAFALQEEIEAKMGPRIPAFEFITDLFALPKSTATQIQHAALKAYNQPILGRIKPLQNAVRVLKLLRKRGIQTAIVTSGNIARQKQKIKKLRLSPLVDSIEYHDIEKESSKKKHFESILKKFRLNPADVLCVGDRVHSEIKAGNALGMTTVRFLHGRYACLKPATKLEVPDFEITSLSKIPSIIRMLDKQRANNLSPNPRIVVIGGGSGMANLLLGLKNYTKNLTAIITVTDTGRSSGRLRKDFNVLAPGDVRNCLVALSSHEEILKNLFQYRFTEGELSGHSFGNLFLVALYKLTGNFEKAIFEAGKILGITGQVLPATITNTHICARLSNGKVLVGEDAITARNTRVHQRAPIVEVFLKPKNAKAPLEAVNAIARADLVVIGPGQLYNSVIANLLVPDIRKALSKTSALKVYICNIMTQQGQTDHYTAADHTARIQGYLNTLLDFVLVNRRVPPRKHLRDYEKEHAYMVKADLPRIRELGVEPIVSDLLSRDTGKKFAFDRREYLRHDPDKLARALLDLL